MIYETSVDFQIARELGRLDEIAIEFEAKWGVDVLPNLVPLEIKEKWDRQNEKLSEAVHTKNLTAVTQLVEGSIRGWNKLAQTAMANGHKPRDPEVWEIAGEDGEVYRITKTLTDARIAAAPGVSTWSLSEVARVLGAHRLKDVQEIKREFPGVEVKAVTGEFDFEKGDDLPF